jgi:ELP3 family radical SAM enzyme/protein acetyltransferase
MDIEDIIPVKKYQYTDEVVKPFVEELILTSNSIKGKLSNKDIDNLVKTITSKYRICPAKPQMRSIYDKYFKEIPIRQEIQRYFIKRVMRSESGVLVVTIVTKPGDNIKFSCPEKCAYCPTETDLSGKPTQPKSYISTEPAMLRATRHEFDIGEQIRDRIRSYMFTGNMKKDNKKKKIEVILSGGTWDVMPKDYRDQVINEIYYTFNTLGNESEKRPMLSIEEEKEENEKALFGVIGLTIETRPDYVIKKSLLEYLEYGVTRVQLGGQSTHDDVLLKIKRGCTKKNICQAIRLLKSIGLKVVTHWMPDLPGSSLKKDIEMFDELIENPDLQSDDWKVYPCAVVKSASDDLIIKSEINEWYENGSYVPYSETNIEDLINLCIGFKRKINPWVRIERLVRDIPTKSIEAGYSKVVNLRQIIQDRIPGVCKCIRCMEIKDRADRIGEAKLVVRRYMASQGIEYHISYELEKQYWCLPYILFCIWYWMNRFVGKTVYYEGNRELYSGLFGFLRLRIDANPGIGLVPELVGCGLIREVHVYGMSISVGNTNTVSSQHKGVGQQLMNVAEDIIKTHGLKKAAVIAGIGAREYYKNKCGYELGKYYMIKNL